MEKKTKDQHMDAILPLTTAKILLKTISDLEWQYGILPIVSSPMSVFCFTSLVAFQYAWTTWLYPEIIHWTNQRVCH